MEGEQHQRNRLRAEGLGKVKSWEGEKGGGWGGRGGRRTDERQQWCWRVMDQERAYWAWERGGGGRGGGSSMLSSKALCCTFYIIPSVKLMHVTLLDLS